MTVTDDYETVLQIVSHWPSAQRFVLLQAVLRTLAVEVGTERPKLPSADVALGVLATHRPAPSDAEVEHWLEERRLEKYG